MKKINFTVVGAGWRSEFYFRIASELPDLFNICAVVETNSERAAQIKQRYGFDIKSSTKELSLDSYGDFLVLCLPQPLLPSVIKNLTYRGFYLLSESFEAADLNQLVDFYNSLSAPHLIQVSEQYSLQPMHAARLNVINSGKIGDVTQAYVSSGHGYHGMSLVRKYLGKTFENCTIKGKLFTSKLIKSPGRDGYPDSEEYVDETQQFAFLDFGDTLGFYYFTDDQYFSPIRLPDTRIRATKGEITNTRISMMLNYNTPLEYQLSHVTAGQNESVSKLSSIGITAGETWYYKNSYYPARFSDDEIAIATALEKMYNYVHNKHSFYSIQEGCQDQYLSLMIKQSFYTDKEIATDTQPWAR